MPPPRPATTAAFAGGLGALRRGDRAPLAAALRAHLFTHVLPFWERHAVDPAGGLCTCIADDGTILSREKWLWSQWRAVWVFSRVYETLDRNPVWLDRARGIADFCLRHGWMDTDQGWALLLDHEGRVLRGYESVYVDGFAIYGLAQLYATTKDERYRTAAVRTADAVQRRLAGPRDRLPHFPYPIPAGAKPQGIAMIFSLKFAELGRIVGEERFLAAARGFADEIFQDHYSPRPDLVFEWARPQGGRLDGPDGGVVVPGHIIESMWFQLEVMRAAGGPDGRREMALHLIRRHLEAGWDHAGPGGLFLAIDVEGRDDVAWKFADTKLWWPQTEALYATLRGWHETGDPAFLDWYDRLWALCLDHYVDWSHGEWRQKLNRDLTPLSGTIALPVKDPFHLPRSLIHQIELLETHSGPASRPH